METSPEEVEPWGHDDHVHDFHQFVVVMSGYALFRVEGVDFEVVPRRGLWIPAGMVHRARFSADALLTPLNFDEVKAAGMPAAPAEVVIGPELRDALGPALRAAMLNLEDSGVIADAYRALRQVITTVGALPLPEDGAAATVARWLLAHPEDTRTLGDWAAELFVSEATIRRAFLAGTGVTFTRWRNTARMHAALRLLADDLPVSVVAARVGFASVNGFILAFRREFGRTPGRHGTLRDAS
ncbi:AraC family transcriptional regulator [Amycolatopsis umgeniensis]|uniref:AraC-like DNA-binding protein n=1 Tax=Amycolatopsis umgeniensis TaxID=336628 RepID=A0A841AP14_9PSEU|nr:AraC-like DNA-binding protein [Amycolatopsis umgeniensis]